MRIVLWPRRGVDRPIAPQPFGLFTFLRNLADPSCAPYRKQRSSLLALASRLGGGFPSIGYFYGSGAWTLSSISTGPRFTHLFCVTFIDPTCEVTFRTDIVRSSIPHRQINNGVH